MQPPSDKYRHETQPSMLRRMQQHDYQSRCIYLVTVMKADDCPRLCEVTGSIDHPIVTYSAVGKIVNQELYMLPIRYPQVQILAYQIMPDHVHVVLYVKERLPESLYLGNIVASWKACCSKVYWEHLNLKAQAQSTDAMPQRKSVFAKGFNDSVLRGGRPLQTMIAYVHANPQRLMIRRANGPLFAIRRSVAIAGMQFDAVGNMELLKLRKRVVHCHRRWSEIELERYKSECKEAMRSGMVLVSPFISKSEREIMQQAEDSHSALIRLVENGFPDRYKPIGKSFEICASGKLLMLAPWNYHTQRRHITCQQCQDLNDMAVRIASI